MVGKQNCVMCFIVYIKTNDIYKYIAEDVETKFDFQIMNQIAHWLKEKIKKVIRLMKDEYFVENHEKNCWIKNKNLDLIKR